MPDLMSVARAGASAVVVISLRPGKQNRDWPADLLTKHKVWVDSEALPGSKALIEYAQAIEKVVREALAQLPSTRVMP